MARAIAIVFTFGAQQEAVEAPVLAHRVESIAAPGEHFVHVALVADVQDETVPRGVENAVKRNGQLTHSEVRSQMPAGLGEDLDQLIAYLLRELRQVLFAKRFDVGWRTDSIEQTLRRVCRLGGLRIFRRV